MKQEEFDINCRLRGEVLVKKAQQYKDAWRGYSMNTLVSLAKNRLDEVVYVFQDTGKIDIDNLIDAMNFCDFILTKNIEHSEKKN